MPVSPVMPVFVGQRVGPYRIVRLIGEGGMGLVYEAVHETHGGRAAIKALRPELLERPDAARRFLTEARAAARVEHPGLVRIHDCGRIEGGPVYLIMEYLEGESLRARQRRQGGLALAEALRLSRQLASALGAAHGRGVIHRDVKPDNVLIVADAEAPGGERAKLLDFGIAKLLSDEGGEDPDGTRTRPGAVLGSPRYLSPEQCGGTVTDRADVYSLGVVLHELCAGRPPFDGASSGDLIAKHITEPPPRLRDLNKDVPAELEALVLAMLDKEPAERPSMREVERCLHAIEGGAGGITLPAQEPRRTAASSGLPKASRLEQLVADDLHRGTAAALETASGPVPQLSPRAFQDIITAFLLHEGERFWVSGAVLRQRGISLAEAGALLSDCGVGARFLLEPARAGEAFFLTVYTVLAAHTRSLQERLGTGAPMTMVLRVLAARPGAHDQTFPGFAMYGSQTSHPWTLVVDELVKP